MPPPPPVDQANSELEALQLRSNQITDESLDCTKRMVALCVETEQVGARTLGTLYEQGEQLKNVDAGMDQINENMQKAEKNLRNMEKCCGLCVLPCNKSNEIENDDKAWKGNADVQTCHVQPTRVRDNSNEVPNGGFINKITNDAREDEMDAHMGQVSNLLGSFRNIALDMESELSKQNTQLDGINEKAALNEVRIKAGNDRAEKLLKK